MIRLKTYKWLILVATTIVFVDTSFGQRKAARRPATNQQNNQPRSAYATDTTQKPVNNNQQSAYSNVGNAGKASVDTTLPVQVIQSSGNGLLDTSAKMSLRNDAGVDQNLVKDKAPLPYEHIREDDAVFRVRVWRMIDAREKMNLPFRYAANEDNGNQRFISILLRAISKGDITAFSADD